ncbi:MAG: APC family permease [Acidobacteria bacterium]|nr:APC family permease [Acidobacteriota bacterium]MBI3664532.1 APC family permease [Acidobacteriota bacterium]
MTTASASTPSAVPHASESTRFKKLKLGGFVAVLYAYCAAGPFGFEEMISTSGPGMSLIFLLAAPWLFSLPMSLATSEMATAMPVEGGFYRWTRAAFGDFWGFQCGWWNWTGTFLMNGAYAVVLADYTSQLFPSLNGGWRHWLTALFFLAVVAWVNIRGIQVVGGVTVALLLTVLVPVAVFTLLGFVKMQVNPFVPLTPPGKPWREVYGVGLALALWLYSGYEQLSTITEEVENPPRNFPLGLAIMVPLAMVTFFLPIAAGIGAGADWQKWTTGYLVTVARGVGGEPLAWAMFSAAMIAVLLGLQSTLLSSTRLPFTMSEDGYFHASFAKLDERYRTPVQAIVLTSAICAGLAVFSLPKLIATYMWLRVATSVLTLLSVWRLRRTRPEMPRGFRIPGGEVGVAAVVIVPSLLFAWLLINSDTSALIWGPASLALGPVAAVFLLKKKASA